MILICLNIGDGSFNHLVVVSPSSSSYSVYFVINLGGDTFDTKYAYCFSSSHFTGQFQDGHFFFRYNLVFCHKETSFLLCIYSCVYLQHSGLLFCSIHCDLLLILMHELPPTWPVDIKPAFLSFCHVFLSFFEHLLISWHKIFQVHLVLSVLQPCKQTFLSVSIPFNGEWYLEMKIQILGVLVGMSCHAFEVLLFQWTYSKENFFQFTLIFSNQI